MILFVDDEPSLIEYYAHALRSKGQECHVVSSLAELEAFLRTDATLNCVVLDVMFPNERDLPLGLAPSGNTMGLPLFAGLRSRFPTVPIVILSSVAKDSPAAKFFGQQENCTFLHKAATLPFELAAVVDNLVRDVYSEVLAMLHECPTGREHAKQYEETALRVLEVLFVPPFSEVVSQSRREDGRSIRDAILPNDVAHTFWQSVRNEFDANHIVVEFKNYAELFGKAEVLQLRDYLSRKSLGRFGLLLSRCGPSTAALQAQRDAYQDDDKLSLFVTDEHLREMLEISRRGGDPTDVLRKLKKEFELRY